jgi:hypothetical protein
MNITELFQNIHALLDPIGLGLVGFAAHRLY